jgi:hypothetical protein
MRLMPCPCDQFEKGLAALHGSCEIATRNGTGNPEINEIVSDACRRQAFAQKAKKSQT